MAETPQQGKPYFIKFEQRPGFLYVYVQGQKDSLDISIAYWTEILEFCEGKNVSRLLVEEDFATDNTLFDTYELISRGQQTSMAKVKVAFVDRHQDQMKTNLFGETVAYNRGLIGKVFSDVGKAEEWLLS